MIGVGCKSSSSSNANATKKASPTGSPTTRPSATTAATVAKTGAAAVCPTLDQANTALGASYSGPVQSPAGGGGIVCEYTSPGGNAGVTIFAHQSATVFAGQVANAAGTVAGMKQISGLGDGAFGLTAGGRSVVNAYSNASRTVVAAQAPGALAPVEALARVALADN